MFTTNVSNRNVGQSDGCREISSFRQRGFSFPMGSMPLMPGAIVVFLGVPVYEVAHQQWTQHHVLADAASGRGPVISISVSADEDRVSAPRGYRAVMISASCNPDDWNVAPHESYAELKERLADGLIDIARRVYPRLGDDAVVWDVAIGSSMAAAELANGLVS